MNQAQPALNEPRLPRAVQRQVARTNEIVEAERKRREPGTDPVATSTTTVEPAAPPVEPQPPTPATSDTRRNDPAYWERRIATLTGFWNKDRQTYVQEIEGLHQRVVELEEENATLKARPSAPSSSIDLGKYFTPEQVERIGEEEAMSIAIAAEKAAQTAADAAFDRMKASMKPAQERQQRDADREAAQKQRDFVAALEAEIPDIQELNKTQGWLDWLVQADGDSAFTRQETIDRHQDALDVPAVIKMVKAYRKTLEVPAPPIAPASDTTRTETPITQLAAAGKHPSTAEIREFYKRAALNKVTDAERVEFEARLKLPRPSQ